MACGRVGGKVVYVADLSAAEAGQVEVGGEDGFDGHHGEAYPGGGSGLATGPRASLDLGVWGANHPHPTPWFSERPDTRR
ncbi:MAG: hypothetical protein HBSAPP03_26190 [Phycisphaerae bacterium]|nr:MAG: hypothetical protein HBSAPP03_26190 [Phycisphaerae bacterium]